MANCTLKCSTFYFIGYLSLACHLIEFVNSSEIWKTFITLVLQNSVKLFGVCLECFWIVKFLCKANKLSYQFNNAFKSFLQVEVFSLSHRSTGIKAFVKRQINSFNCIWLSLITRQRLILTHNIWSSDALRAAPLVRGHSNLCQHFRV